MTGVAGSGGLLPEGWVNYTSVSHANAWVGIGAGFWTDPGDEVGTKFRVEERLAAQCLLWPRARWGSIRS